MELLGDVGHVDSRFAQVDALFGPFGDSASVDAIKVYVLRRTYQNAQKSFWAHLMELLGDVGHLESCFSPFGDSVSVGA
jgi:hypothetical protein